MGNGRERNEDRLRLSAERRCETERALQTRGAGAL